MAEGDGKIYRTFKEDVMCGHHNLDTGGNTLKTGTGTTGERGKFDADNVTWTGLNIAGTSASPTHAILYNDSPTSPADPLIAYWEVTTATNGGDYTLAWNAAGILILYGGN